jgi:hypothetical protein
MSLVQWLEMLGVFVDLQSVKQGDHTGQRFDGLVDRLLGDNIRLRFLKPVITTVEIITNPVVPTHFCSNPTFFRRSSKIIS